MPVEFTPAGDEGPPGAAGAWLPSAAEIERTWGIVEVLIAAITSVPDRGAAELSYGERYTLGVRAAGRWTRGLTSTAPLSGEDVPPDREHAVRELALAEVLVESDRMAADPAAGVRAWLAWLLGLADEMVFVTL